MSLDKRKKLFCKFVAQGYSIPNSAIQAGFAKATADTKSHLWLGNSEVKEEIERLKAITQKVADEKFSINQEWIVSGIKQVITNAGSKEDYNAQLKGYDMLGKISGIYEKDNKQKSSVANLVEAAEKIKKALH